MAQASSPSKPSDGAVFDAPVTPTRGWQGLGRVLDALTPSAETAVPLSPSQVTQKINQMINEGKAQEALESIERREAQRQQRAELGTDVQLLFLKGRALSALNRHAEAIELYRELTIAYPELPEPWNNLAAEHMRQNNLALAEEALEMALVANPNYAIAQTNLGEVRLRLAQQAFDAAGALANSRAHQTRQILQQ